MDEICKNCGHSKSSHPSCAFCDCKTFELEDVTQEKGPASEVDMDDWCIDCGHHITVHNMDSNKCKYWTDLCECKGFVRRSEALNAIRKELGFVSRSEIIQAVRKLEKEIREL